MQSVVEVRYSSIDLGQCQTMGELTAFQLPLHRWRKWLTVAAATMSPFSSLNFRMNSFMLKDTKITSAKSGEFCPLKPEFCEFLRTTFGLSHSSNAIEAKLGSSETKCACPTIFGSLQYNKNTIESCRISLSVWSC